MTITIQLHKGKISTFGILKVEGTQIFERLLRSCFVKRFIYSRLLCLEIWLKIKKAKAVPIKKLIKQEKYLKPIKIKTKTCLFYIKCNNAKKDILGFDIPNLQIRILGILPCLTTKEYTVTKKTKKN